MTGTGPGIRTGRRNPFSRRATFWLLAIGASSLVVALVFALFGERFGEPPSHHADSYSRSAIGQHAFVRLLRRLDVPVLVSRWESGKRAGASGVLVVAEPEPGRAPRDMVTDTDAALVVLPKWIGVAPRPDSRGHLAEVALVTTGRANAVLDLFAPGTVVRPSRHGSWYGPDGLVPEIEEPQLAVSEALHPIAWNDDGILLGETWIAGTRVLVLSDPDLLSNHGLHRGDNAALAMFAIEMLREGERTVVVDETAHGYSLRPSIWAALGRFPLVLVTAQVLLAALCLLWASLERFGAPLDEGTGHRPGSAYLLGNTAALLLHGGHGGHTLERYLDAAVRDVLRRLHAPRGLARAAQRAWLERAGTARNVTHSLGALERELGRLSSGRRAERQMMLSAGRIHRWREEMLRGSRDHPATR
jgi:hypothetical protein